MIAYTRAQPMQDMIATIVEGPWEMTAETALKIPIFVDGVKLYSKAGCLFRASSFAMKSRTIGELGNKLIHGPSDGLL